MKTLVGILNSQFSIPETKRNFENDVSSVDIYLTEMAKVQAILACPEEEILPNLLQGINDVVADIKEAVLSQDQIGTAEHSVVLGSLTLLLLNSIQEFPHKDFGVCMLAKLTVNLHKAHWEKLSNEALLERLIGEVQELMAEVDKRAFFPLVLEAADVANYCMMLFSNNGGILAVSGDLKVPEGTMVN